MAQQGHLAGGATLVAPALSSDYIPLSGDGYAPVQGTAKFYYLPKGKNAWMYLGSSVTAPIG